MYYETYCFAFQKRLFCNVKPMLLPCKIAAFAMPNRNYRFLSELFLQNQGDFQNLRQFGISLRYCRKPKPVIGNTYPWLMM